MPGLPVWLPRSLRRSGVCGWRRSVSEIVTQEMMDAFGAAWASTPKGAPGDRTRAGLNALLDVIAYERNKELSQQHLDDPMGKPLFGTVPFAESFDKEGDLVHVCRDADGNVLLYTTLFGVPNEAAVMDESVVRWLSGVLTAALDDWPRD